MHSRRWTYIYNLYAVFWLTRRSKAPIARVRFVQTSTGNDTLLPVGSITMRAENKSCMWRCTPANMQAIYRKIACCPLTTSTKCINYVHGGCRPMIIIDVAEGFLELHIYRDCKSVQRVEIRAPLIMTEQRPAVTPPPLQHLANQSDKRVRPAFSDSHYVLLTRCRALSLRGVLWTNC